MVIRSFAVMALLSSVAMADGSLDMNCSGQAGKIDCLIHGLQQLKRLGCELGEDSQTSCSVRNGSNVLTKNCDFPITYQDPQAAKNGAADRDCKKRGMTYVPNDVLDPVFPGVCKRVSPTKSSSAATKPGSGSAR